MYKDNPLLYLFKKISWPWSLIALSIFISSLGSLTGILIPLFTGKIVDNFTHGGINFYFIIIFCSIFILNALLGGIGLYLLIKIGEHVIYSIRKLLWKHLIYLNTTFFDRNENGQIISRITDDTNLINIFISQKLPSLFPTLLTVIGSIIMLLILDWKMTMLIFTVLPILFVIMIPLSKIIQRISFKTQKEIADFSGFLGKIITVIRLVKVSNTEEQELKKSYKSLEKIYILGIKRAKIFALIQPLSSLTILLSIGIILGFGGIRVVEGAITSGTLVSMIFYVIQLSMPLTNLSTLFNDYQKAVGGSQRIYEIMKEKEENYNLCTSTKPFEDGDLIFKNVSFKYKNLWILKNLNLYIEKGTTVALVGPSGSGKTTILNLISRIYSINQGNITINNKSIYDIDLTSLRKNIGHAMQDNNLISGSIEHNLMYGTNKKINYSELIEYTQLTNCHNFIQQLQKDYKTVVEENGKNLSGGERQRINITRNFIKNPNILLLDEITSNLDSNSELKIQRALNHLMKNKTILISAHRLSTIKSADKIIFLDNGVITGEGTHETLLNTHDKYRNFVLSQKID
ncbi:MULTISPECIES: ABC transporter ATP-binding protein [Staphylococcus]|uniref:Lipid A export ATP-binding/permease protein MsbA n=4 Tax=Bacilli TaxID=91061 RepID=A0A0M2NSF5_STACC|nr:MULTISPECIES: ABC transporter ATP-binding protein [Staphylococcus]KKI62962.1 Lipid A export ATP-binding/permease protein MsbA [Staphylococcus cohnii subsp. cohnii]MCT1915573.1 ABC transporter ATP-binding protein/permease [Staphylococcus ureilyticus]